MLMRLLYLGLILVLPGFLRAQSDTLLAPPSDPVTAGREVRLKLYLNNPSAEAVAYELPAVLEASLATHTEQTILSARVVAPAAPARIEVAPMSFTVLEVGVTIPTGAAGVVAFRLSNPATNAVMFSVAAPSGASPVAQASPPEATPVPAAAETLSLDNERERLLRHIAAYDPIYFAAGTSSDTNAKFQFSFKYRLFATQGNVPQWWRDLYFAYTQTSLWDLDSLSRPFYDTSYKPTIFYRRDSYAWTPAWLDRLGVQIGLQHESNGKSDPDSRSLNTVYVTPIVSWVLGRKWSILFAPRFIGYIESSENGAIADYRGYAEVFLRIGKDDGFRLDATFRPASGDRLGSGSLQLDATWPLKDLPGMPDSVGGHLLAQWFTGYGESLLSFDRRFSDQLRVGITLVR